MPKIILFIFILICFSSCSDEPESNVATSTIVDQVTLQLNWFPEAEHGGYFHGVASGIYEKAGIDVQILNGGPGVPVETEVGISRVEFGIANADKILSVRENGLKIIALLAPYQQTPRCLISHKKHKINRFEDLIKAKQLIVNNTKPFYKYLLKKYPDLKKVKTIPYSQATFLSDSENVIQGYINSEPLVFEEKGIEVNTLKLSDIGFNPYASVLICSETLLNENPDLVKRMIQASKEAWQAYLKDPTLGNASIVKRNPKIEHHLKASSQQLAPMMQVQNQQSFGSMDKKRWQVLAKQLKDIGLLKSIPKDLTSIWYQP